MVRVGIAGLGFMGVTHFGAWEQVRGATVTAVQTRSARKLAGDWSTVQGNFGGAGGVRDLSNLRRHATFADLLADPEIELVDICLPTPLHARSAIAAMEAGKHVLVEKPIALDLADADRMLEASQRCGRMLMVAHVVRFWPQFAYLKALHEQGELGELLALNLRRLISRPGWSDTAADLPASGGPLIDLHIHDADFMRYLLGEPEDVSCIGRVVGGTTVLHIAAQYRYRSGAVVSCQSGAVATAGRSFTHGFEANFERGTVRFAGAAEPAVCMEAPGRATQQALTIYRGRGEVEYPAMPAHDGFLPQLQHVADCVAGGGASGIISGQEARASLALVLRERAMILAAEADRAASAGQA